MNENLWGDLWDDNDIQFCRLLAEISMMGLMAEDKQVLCESMDLDLCELESLFIRAENKWEMLKRKHLPNYKPDLDI